MYSDMLHLVDGFDLDHTHTTTTTQFLRNNEYITFSGNQFTF
jgi:hypothetical protein